MSTRQVRPHTHRTKYLTAFAVAIGCIALAGSTAFAQGWDAGRGHGRSHGVPAPHDAYGPGHHDCSDTSHHHGEPGHHGSDPIHVYSCEGPDIDVRPRMSDHSVYVNTRGAVACTDVTGRACAGFVSRRPLCLDVRYPTEVDIEVTSADVDTVLALVGPGVSHADDDGGNGTNSRITRLLERGEYRLYTGTYHRRDRGSLSLSISDADAGRFERPRRPGRGRGHGRGRHVSYDPGLAASCAPGSQVVYLNQWDSSALVDIAAYGEIDSSDVMGRFESGWLPRTAQVCLVVDSPAYYDLEVVRSEADTVLGVVSANGWGTRLFDDDGGGGWLLSRVSGFFGRGAYHVYVGTFGRFGSEPAQLALSRR